MKKTTLYYTASNSDKVYSAWLEPFGDNFNVAIEYGRRGGNLAGGIKTPNPLPLAGAQKVLDRLIAEKMSKGYTLDARGNPFDGDVGKLADVLSHPTKELVNLATMRNFSAWDFLIQRKYDGELSKIKIGGATILTEFMRTPISGHFYNGFDKIMFNCYSSGWHAAITVMEVHGENVLTRSTRERWGILCSFAGQFTPGIILAETVTDVAACMTSGAEGVCAHAWDAPWGRMFAHKASSIYVCEVTNIGGTQSVGIRDAETKQDRGRVKLGGGKCDQVRVGSLIRVEAMGETDSGKLRQPVPCREWLVKV